MNPNLSTRPFAFMPTLSRRDLLSGFARLGLIDPALAVTALAVTALTVMALAVGGCDNDFGVSGGTKARVAVDEIQGRLYDLAAKGDLGGLVATIQEAQAAKIDLNMRNSTGLRALDIAALNDRASPRWRWSSVDRVSVRPMPTAIPSCISPRALRRYRRSIS